MGKKNKRVYSKNELVMRGWTNPLMDSLLPQPMTKTNTSSRNSAPTQLWSIDSVMKAESSDIYQNSFLQQNRRKIDRLIRETNALKEELERVKTQTRALEQISKIDAQCQKLLKDIENVLGYTRRGLLAHETIKVVHDDAMALLFDGRAAYVQRFNAMYNCDIRLQRNYMASIDDLVFQSVVNETIPNHPKDEFALTRLMKRKFTIHSGATNTGKTYHAIEALTQVESGVYLAPLRLLALQVFQQLNDDNKPCSLITGEEETLVENAKYISSTIEKLNLDSVYDLAIIDEAQMISEAQRGSAWTKAVLGVRAKEVHICCSSNAIKLLTRLIDECGDSYEIISYVRDTPLLMDQETFIFPDGVCEGDALIAFSKKVVLGIASYLADKGISASVIYGDLPPEARKKQVELFVNKENKVVVATDAIGMGLNLPIKRIVFMENTKFDGVRKRMLTASEIKQIAGRAGRKNIYDEGYVNAIGEKTQIGRLLGGNLSDLTRAYYLPLDKYLFTMPIGTLRERLIESMTKVMKVEPFLGADIEQPLALLSHVEDKKELSIEEQYSLIFIPFDINKAELYAQWHGYMESYIKYEEIQVPMLDDYEDLETLEIYYKQLDLYYSFCKTMRLFHDSQWIIEQKQETAARIHTLLTTTMETMSRKCRRCGKPTPWNHEYGLCQNCFAKERGLRYSRYDDDWDD
ncbi:MAG: hypothetical protein FWG88_04125 [Oscillospiraceae bacterium]|nr:hypothetical protein [Oscillospiraceae bacterium]